MLSTANPSKKRVAKPAPICHARANGMPLTDRRIAYRTPEDRGLPPPLEPEILIPEALKELKPTHGDAMIAEGL